MPLGTLVQFMLPRWVMARIAVLAGALAYRFSARKRARLETNCRHILGNQATPQQVEQVVRRTFRHLVMNYLDLLRIPVLRRRLWQLVEYDDAHIRRTIGTGRACIIVTPHLGNWDMAGAFLAALGYPLSAVVEPVPRGWERTFRRYRGATAMETIPIPDHARIAGSLQRQRILALVADRDLTGSGIVCPAFDAQRAFPRGPAAYSLRFEAPIIIGHFVFQHRPGRRPYLGTVEPPLQFERTGDLDRDIPALTALVARHLNELIAQYPDQWPVFHAAWK
jgi:KDO2-lipid IV(A) lauroyltransferase